MSRRPRSPAPPAVPGEVRKPTPPLSRWPWGRAAGTVIAVLVIVWMARGAWRDHAPAPPLSEEGLEDSLRAAAAAGRSDRVLFWIERQRGRVPFAPDVMITHALALHDHAWAGAPTGRERTALRTTLERVETDLRVIAMLDSAGKITTATAVDRATAGRYLGMEFENYGLQVDALRLYVSAFARAGDDTLLAQRINHLVALLRDPLAEPAPP